MVHGGQSHKRKRQELKDNDGADSDSGFSEVQADSSDDEIDISNALTGKKARRRGPQADSESERESDDEDLQEIIRTSISKRDKKEGTEMLKKTKGKKITKGEVGGGSFQSMGLHPWLLRSLTLQGFRIPTPIQRLAIPSLLSNPPRDLVGMARTGSGKSLAYLIPLVQRLGGQHSTTFGARALILLPARELALQVLKVGKELARGYHAGDGGNHAGDAKTGDDSKKGQALRWGLVVGGEGLDEQFEMISNNPDVIIATPGRLLHLIVEMNLDLKSVQYVVFDEADRLFEMGFETALTEILHRLPPTRQTLLFSATLPKSLVEFAKAGLENPKLVRLDAESKISTDLRMAFFSVKQAEKDAALLVLLRDVIGVPLGQPKSNEYDDGEGKDKKGKGKARARPGDVTTAPHQTLVFAATKHHVEYLTNMLSSAGYAVSHIYGTLDQLARTQQMDQFRRGFTSILVVTDVAARGIDIPVLENVVNYDFPQGARVFVHRVGRTARAGRTGWAWSFVTHGELPFLLDLQLFLGRPVTPEVGHAGDQAYTESLVLGPFERDRLDDEVEYVRRLDEENSALPGLREMMRRGHSMYERSKGKASPASYTRAKTMMKEGKWGLVSATSTPHPVLLRSKEGGVAPPAEDIEKRLEAQKQRKDLLLKVNAFKPAETVLELGAKNNSETAMLMKNRRVALGKAALRAQQASTSAAMLEEDEDPSDESEAEHAEVEMADEQEIATVFDPSGKSSHGKGSHKDSEYYMSHYQKDAHTEKGYSLRDGATFAEQAQHVTFDLAGDDAAQQERKRRELRWDKTKKKFIKGTGEGADNVKMVKTESGAKLPVSYRSGRFDEWKAKAHVNLPRVGEEEAAGRGNQGGRKWKHNRTDSAKPLDKFRGDYERKVAQFKKKQGTGEAEPSKGAPGAKGKGKGKPMGGRFNGKSAGKVKNELKTVAQIRKARTTADRKREKNARGAHHGGKGRKGRR